MSGAAVERANRAFTLWLTGLSGAGKSTLAEGIRNELITQGYAVEVLDGDDIRARFGPELTFSKADRNVSVRRLGFMALLLSRNGIVALVATISPYREMRDEVRRAHGASFVEVYVECPIEELIRRDTKGLYAKALKGEIRHFTGISDPYEPPPSAEIRIRTDLATPRQSVLQILSDLDAHGLIERRSISLSSRSRGIQPCRVGPA